MLKLYFRRMLALGIAAVLVCAFQPRPDGMTLRSGAPPVIACNGAVCEIP
jgi:hypothetical protein